MGDFKEESREGVVPKPQRWNALFKNVPTTLFYTGALLTSLLVISMAVNDYPTPLADAEGTVPASINAAQGKGFINSTFMLSRVIDGGRNRYTYHGFFLYSLIGKLLPRDNPGEYIPFIWTGLALLAAFLSLYLIKHFISPQGEAFGYIDCAACICSCWLILSIALQTAPRSEGFCLVLTTLAALWMMYCPEITWSHAVVLGIVVGIQTASSPAVGVTIGLIGSLYFSACAKSRPVLFSLAAAVISLLTFLIVFQLFFPFSFSDWIAGLRQNAGVSFIKFSVNGLNIELFQNLECPGVGLYLLAAVGCTGWVLIKFWKQIQFKALFVFFAVVYAFVLSNTFAPNGYSRYSTLPYASLLCGLIVYVIKRSPKPVAVILLFCLAVPSLGFIRTAALFSSYMKTGVKLASAREKLNAVGIPADKLAAVSAGVIYFAGNLDNLIISDITTPAYRFQANSYDYFVLLQRERSLLKPPAIPGFELQADCFVNARATLFGIQIARTVPGFAFATYKKVKDAPPSYLIEILPNAIGAALTRESIFTGLLRTGEKFHQKIEFSGTSLKISEVRCDDPRVKLTINNDDSMPNVDIDFTADDLVRRTDHAIDITIDAGRQVQVLIVMRAFVIGSHARVPKW